MALDKGPYVAMQKLMPPGIHQYMFSNSICITIMSVHRCLYLTLDGYVYTQWRLKVKHIRPYPWCSSMKAYHHLWWWMAQRSRLCASFAWSLWMTPVSWNKQSCQNAPEREIKELKEGLGNKMLATRSPRCLCDDCLELEVHIPSHSANNVCYAQLCLAWIPGNPSLWIPVPPVSLYFSDVRFTTWTYPSHSLADIWFNACSVASHTASCFTHILIIPK